MRSAFSLRANSICADSVETRSTKQRVGGCANQFMRIEFAVAVGERDADRIARRFRAEPVHLL